MMRAKETDQHSSPELPLIREEASSGRKRYEGYQRELDSGVGSLLENGVVELKLSA